MRKHIFHITLSLSNLCPPTESEPVCENESFSSNTHQTPQYSSTFSHCTFISCTSDQSGGAISFSESTSGTLTVQYCLFHTCIADIDDQNGSGGGAIYVSTGTLFSVSSSDFIRCSTPTYGGAIFAYNQCSFVDESFCTFISCTAFGGGGVQLWLGPSSHTSSCVFLCCEVSYSGGGIYNNHNTAPPITISNSLFKGNTALYSNATGDGVRGGGGFEDYGTGSYESHYSFSFFTENSAPNGAGHDITKPNRALTEENVTHCFTTTEEHAIWSGGQYVNWLSQTIINVNLTSFTPIHILTSLSQAISIQCCKLSYFNIHLKQHSPLPLLILPSLIVLNIILLILFFLTVNINASLIARIFLLEQKQFLSLYQLNILSLPVLG